MVIGSQGVVPERGLLRDCTILKAIYLAHFYLESLRNIAFSITSLVGLIGTHGCPPIKSCHF